VAGGNKVVNCTSKQIGYIKDRDQKRTICWSKEKEESLIQSQTVERRGDKSNKAKKEQVSVITVPNKCQVRE
jgi:hypothetical protein